MEILTQLASNVLYFGVRPGDSASQVNKAFLELATGRFTTHFPVYPQFVEWL